MANALKPLDATQLGNNEAGGEGGSPTEINEDYGAEEEVQVDTAQLFAQLKNKFFQEETHLNDEDQLREL